MTMFEYAIARTYYQLLSESEVRVLSEREVRLAETLGKTVNRLEERETLNGAIER